MNERALSKREEKLRELDRIVLGGLVVSCQPVENGPLDDDEVVLRLAQAALSGGARAVRIEGAARLAHLRQAIRAPIIGIVKRDLADSPVRITPLLADVQALIAAGADVIAVDATARPRPVSVAELLHAVQAAGLVAMADCSCLADAQAAATLGFDIVGTTLSGYTRDAVPAEPDYQLLETLSRQLPRVMAEGRYNTPQQAARAMSLGAWAVTVGTAITRTESVAAWFSAALVKRREA